MFYSATEPEPHLRVRHDAAYCGPHLWQRGSGALSRSVSSMRELETQGWVKKDDGAIGDQWRDWEYGTDAPALVQGQWNRIKTMRDD